jgi:hypothetical protein
MKVSNENFREFLAFYKDLKDFLNQKSNGIIQISGDMVIAAAFILNEMDDSDGVRADRFSLCPLGTTKTDIAISKLVENGLFIHEAYTDKVRPTFKTIPYHLVATHE